MIFRKTGGGGPRPLLFAVAVLLGGLFHGAGEARGQSNAVFLAIEVPAAFEIEPATESPLPIRITPAAAMPSKAMVLIRGLPPTIALTEGRLFESGVWGVRVADLPRLRIAAPAQDVERRELSFSLVTLDGLVLANAASSLAVVSASAAGRRGNATAARVHPDARPPQDDQPAASPGEQKPSLTLEEIERAQLYMRKGEENMRAGNVVVARLFFARAANAGWAPGAFALATTYDPAELGHLPLGGGIKADPVLARKWYEKAYELGEIEAPGRLKRLEGR